jgi:hypothetical protein
VFFEGGSNDYGGKNHIRYRRLGRAGSCGSDAGRGLHDGPGHAVGGSPEKGSSQSGWHGNTSTEARSSPDAGGRYSNTNALRGYPHTKTLRSYSHTYPADDTIADTHSAADSSAPDSNPISAAPIVSGCRSTGWRYCHSQQGQQNLCCVLCWH